MRLTKKQKELAAYVDRRLWEGDAANLKAFMGTAAADRKTVVAKTVYEARKRLARDGDLAPLCNFLVGLTGDTEIVDFIAQPPPTPWPKSARKDLARSAGLRSARGDYIKRIRNIIREKTGRAVPRNDLDPICSEVLDCPAPEIANIIKHGY